MHTLLLQSCQEHIYHSRLSRPGTPAIISLNLETSMVTDLISWQENFQVACSQMLLRESWAYDMPLATRVYTTVFRTCISTFPVHTVIKIDRLRLWIQIGCNSESLKRPVYRPRGHSTHSYNLWLVYTCIHCVASVMHCVASVHRNRINTSFHRVFPCFKRITRIEVTDHNLHRCVSKWGCDRS